MLIKIAQFDANHDNDLSDEELRQADEITQHLVDLTCATLQNFSVVGSLLFSATFLSAIGRPTPWVPSDDTIDRMGTDGSTALMYTAFALLVRTAPPLWQTSSLVA